MKKIILGNIITMDEKRPFAKVALVKKGVFAYIGSAEEAKLLETLTSVTCWHTCTSSPMRISAVWAQQAPYLLFHPCGLQRFLEVLMNRKFPTSVRSWQTNLTPSSRSMMQVPTWRYSIATSCTTTSRRLRKPTSLPPSLMARKSSKHK